MIAITIDDYVEFSSTDLFIILHSHSYLIEQTKNMDMYKNVWFHVLDRGLLCNYKI